MVAQLVACLIVVQGAQVRFPESPFYNGVYNGFGDHKIQFIFYASVFVYFFFPLFFT
jgi:hypothetical protein